MSSFSGGKRLTWTILFRTNTLRGSTDPKERSVLMYGGVGCRLRSVKGSKGRDHLFDKNKITN